MIGAWALVLIYDYEMNYDLASELGMSIILDFFMKI